VSSKVFFAFQCWPSLDEICSLFQWILQWRWIVVICLTFCSSGFIRNSARLCVSSVCMSFSGGFTALEVEVVSSSGKFVSFYQTIASHPKMHQSSYTRAWDMVINFRLPQKLKNFSSSLATGVSYEITELYSVS
jgi:hypothetical protein